jgi:hypothetical protein
MLTNLQNGVSSESGASCLGGSTFASCMNCVLLLIVGTVLTLTY